MNDPMDLGNFLQRGRDIDGSSFQFQPPPSFSAFNPYLVSPGEVPAAKTTPAPTASPPPSQLPGKKAYIPPYTPKNVNRPNDPPRPSPRPISSR